jgi:precorrin-8X/cobalt-precorrin-8 methylmutase
MIKDFLKSNAIILADTNMILAGLNSNYTEKYNNKTVCYVAEDDVKEIAKQQGITRTTAAVKKALEEAKGKKIILACGNAPTFLYSSIETLLNNNFDLYKIVLIAMPVGFINVVESKEYALEFMQSFNVEGIILKDRYGGSPLVVSCLHALYKLI